MTKNDEPKHGKQMRDPCHSKKQLALLFSTAISLTLPLFASHPEWTMSGHLTLDTRAVPPVWESGEEITLDTRAVPPVWEPSEEITLDTRMPDGGFAFSGSMPVDARSWVTNLARSASADDSLSLSWTVYPDDLRGIDHYAVEFREFGDDGGWTPLTAPGLHAILSPLDGGTVYECRVRPVIGIHEQEWTSIIASVSLPRVQNLTSTYGETDQSIALSWDEVPGAVSYEIYRASRQHHRGNMYLIPKNRYVLIAEVPVPSFEDDLAGVATDLSAFYYIVAKDGDGNRAHRSTLISGWTKDAEDRAREEFVQQLKGVTGMLFDKAVKPLPISFDRKKLLAAAINEGVWALGELVLDGTLHDDIKTIFSRYPYGKSNYSTVVTLCPVDIELHCNTSSLIISKTNAAEHGAIYLEGEFVAEGHTNDVLILIRDIIDSYTVKIVPEPGSDGAEFTAVVGGSGWSHVLYDAEIIDTGKSYEAALPIKFTLEPYMISNDWAIAWAPMADHLTAWVEMSDDLINWQVLPVPIDFTSHYSTSVLPQTNTTNRGFYRVRVVSVPDGMVLVPGGVNAGPDPDGGEYSLTVDSFYMDSGPVTAAKWDKVYNWATHADRGEKIYLFDNAGSGKAANHPVHSVNWYDAIKWCNARSEMNGRVPAYTINGEIFRSGSFGSDGSSAVQCDFEANGFRLPTNVEWEYAARGGLTGKRFPWGDTINHDVANYRANGDAFSFDTSPYSTNTFHPLHNDEVQPYTSPVGFFDPNGFGLYDMSGNVWEWCWDLSGTNRSRRGGGWSLGAAAARLRTITWQSPDNTTTHAGFRTICR